VVAVTGLVGGVTAGVGDLLEGAAPVVQTLVQGTVNAGGGMAAGAAGGGPISWRSAAVDFDLGGMGGVAGGISSRLGLAEEVNVANGETAAIANGPNFIVHPNGDVIPVPDGATGPVPVNSGRGFQFEGGSGGHGLDPRTSAIRLMDPIPAGTYPYPEGYASYSNVEGQTVNPYTGQTVPKSSPWWHWRF
jgi:hypothetical protein